MHPPSPSPSPSPSSPPPNSILIIGAGVFGLSTALALTTRPSYISSTTPITLIDRSPFPNPYGSSVDSSRIIRADYSIPSYATLAASAQTEWRKTGKDDLGGEGRYTESGLVLVCDRNTPGEGYVRSSFENVKRLAREARDEGAVRELNNREKIEAVIRERGGDEVGGSGDWGYINHRSGWADAEAAMIWLRSKVESTGRVKFITGEVTSLIKTPTSITGVQLSSGTTLSADLTILATGAWTPSLVDLRGRATATGQVLSYISLSPTSAAKLSKLPILLNMSSGMFMIPPSRSASRPHVKIARHAYGYLNPTRVRYSKSGSKDEAAERDVYVSLPAPPILTLNSTSISSSSSSPAHQPPPQIPLEGTHACTAFLKETLPSLYPTPFTDARLCWYTDTPYGDFLITHHPTYPNLFLATGGSGHGFKFLPVIGDRIVDILEGRDVEGDLKERWRWMALEKGAEGGGIAHGVEDRIGDGIVVTKDGSRGGKPGLILSEEFAKGGGTKDRNENVQGNGSARATKL